MIEYGKTLLESSQNAVVVFRERGKDALRKVVSAMKIPNTFMLMEKVLHGAAEDMTYRVAQMAALNKELHVAGSHTKNIGRILTGKEVKAVGEHMPEQGLIYKISKSFLSHEWQTFQYGTYGDWNQETTGTVYTKRGNKNLLSKEN